MTEIQKTKRKVNLPKLVDPRFLSVVSLPANRTGFKIIRSRTDKQQATAPKRGEKTILKRSGLDALLSIVLPEGIEETVANEIMHQFSLTDEYRLTKSDGRYVLVKNGIEDDDFAAMHQDVVPIMLENGMQANVVSSALRQDKRNSGVKLVRLTFDRSKFTGVDSVKEWLDKNEIDFIEGGIEVEDEIFNVIRYANTSEKGAVQVEEGVTGIIARGNVQDIPLSIERQVVRDAFGQFGFGHLVFVDYVIDIEFSETSRNALDILGEVLDNILFWSDLPINDRLDLIDNALAQFGAFMRGLVQSIPSSITDVMNQSTVENSDRRNKMARRILKKPDVRESEDTKSKTETEDESVKRTDEDTEETKAENKAEGTEDTAERKDENETESTSETEETQYVTRSELVDAVTEAVTVAFTAHLERSESTDSEQTEETEETEETTERADGDEEESGKEEVMSTMVKTMNKMADAMSAVGEKLGDINKRLSNVEGTAVARGDESTEYSGSEEDKPKSAFSGMFNRSVG